MSIRTIAPTLLAAIEAIEAYVAKSVTDPATNDDSANTLAETVLLCAKARKHATIDTSVVEFTAEAIAFMREAMVFGKLMRDDPSPVDKSTAPNYVERKTNRRWHLLRPQTRPTDAC